MNGVPLLVFPGPIFECRFNARKIQETGAGLMGEVNEFTVDWIARALENQPACAGKAAQLGTRIRSLGGAKAAVEAMQGWISHDRKIDQPCAKTCLTG
jgi:UDP:flavonoid glycosyltransferase YjiC (YdhE family)